MSEPTRIETSERRLVREDHPVPVSTYRVQLGADLTFDDVAGHIPYLALLGITHVYLSPILSAAPGSTHGYDVVDHSEVSPTLGGLAALRRLAETAHAAGLGLVLDIVPNHMAVPTPVWHNRALWSVLVEGQSSPFAAWFDVDWSGGEGAVLIPVLGDRIGAILARDELVLDKVEIPGAGLTTVLRYFDHFFPVRPGTELLPLTELLERQNYRLAYWRVANEELNYRRFFDVGTLVAIRVEDPAVFEATHALVLGLIADGTLDGLRIDHPDGLAFPADYLARLRERTDGAWVVVEKILQGEEELPGDWCTAGTTGYESLWRIQQAFVDPGGAAILGSVLHRLTGDTPDALPAIVEEAKLEIVNGALYAEVTRLTDLASAVCREDLRLRDHTWRALRDCLVELLVAFDRYRAYVVPGEPVHPDSVHALATAASLATARLPPERAATMALLVELLLGREAGSAGQTRTSHRDELVVRFQQTCGAVMAKGVEDTAFYRWTHLAGLCEVGGAPTRFAFTPTELVTWAAHTQTHAPLGMTTLSTHDTKRSEDTRTRMGVLSERAEDWSGLVDQLRATCAPYRSALLDGRTENLLWQTLAGTWTPDGPLPAERLMAYLTKAMREAKSLTTWTEPDADYEAGVLETARQILQDGVASELLSQWEQRNRAAVRVATLGSKLVQFTLPGIPDVYQGTEVPLVALVDPDNRRAVDTSALAGRLARLDEGARPRDLADEKLLVTSRALRTRRNLPQAFIGPEAGFRALSQSTEHAFTFARTVAGEPRIAVLATRLSVALERLGGWANHSVTLPGGNWQDVLTGRTFTGGAQDISLLLEHYPVALFIRTEG